MKPICLFLFFLFINQSYSAAQDPGYNGPAKITIQSFWDGASKLEKSISQGGSSLDADRLAGLRRKIDEVKKKDIGYSTAAMEQKLTSLSAGLGANQAAASKAIQDQRDRRAGSRKASELMGSLLDISVEVGRARLKTVNQEIADYKLRMAELLTLDRQGYASDLQKYRLILKNNFQHAEKDLAELDRRCREQTDGENALANYNSLVFNQAHWDAARQVYPDEPDFGKAYAMATRFLDALGSPAQVNKIAAESKEKKIRECRLPAAAAKDAALEKMFVDAFNQFHSEEFRGTAIKAVVTSNDWSIERNSISGVVTGRVRKGVVVYKDREGRCFLTANIFLRQEYVGSSFSKTVQSAYPVMGSQEIRCENAH